jgi:hypothetical protein
MTTKRLEIDSSHCLYDGCSKPKLVLVVEPLNLDMNVSLDYCRVALFAEADMRKITKFLRTTYEKPEKYIIKPDGDDHWDVQHQQSSFIETTVARFNTFDDAKEYRDFKNKSC